MRPDLGIHMVAGSLGMLSGFIALAVAKGDMLHRKSGMVFVYSMLTVSLIGSTMAAARNVSPFGNIPMGLLTAYLVFTGMTTMRPPSEAPRRLDLGMMLVASAIGATLITFGFAAVANPQGTLGGVPSPAFFIFGTIALLAGAGDLRLIRAGGIQTIRGAPRLARHLWRMCSALLIATLSIGQIKAIPKAYRIYLLIPPLVVLAALLYWLWRVRFRRSFRGIVVARAPDRVAELT